MIVQTKLKRIIPRSVSSSFPVRRPSAPISKSWGVEGEILRFQNGSKCLEVDLSVHQHVLKTLHFLWFWYYFWSKYDSKNWYNTFLSTGFKAIVHMFSTGFSTCVSTWKFEHQNLGAIHRTLVFGFFARAARLAFSKASMFRDLLAVVASGGMYRFKGSNATIR